MTQSQKLDKYRDIFYFLLILFAWFTLVNIAVYNDYEELFYLEVEQNPFADINHMDNLVGIWSFIKLKVDFFYLFATQATQNTGVVDTAKTLLVNLIYAVIFLCFLVQALVTFKLEPKFLSKLDKDKLIEFNLNIPPFLGVIGTVFTFTTFLSSDSAKDMLVLFKENFNLAALTTILGGITYSVNFFLYLIYQETKQSSQTGKVTYLEKKQV